MDIRWLKTFIVAAEYENFRKASEELFLTQPAITKHIKRLEDHLHVPLFERSGKSVMLTPAGYRFLPYAKEIIMTYEERMEDFESWKQGYKRKLMIAAAPQIASSLLPKLLRSFIKQNPDIEVMINVVKSFDIGEEISAGRADLGLTRIQPMQKNIKCTIVHDEPVVLVGPYLEMDREEKNVFNKYRLITHNHPNYWEDLLKDIKRIYPSIRVMAVNQAEVTKRFIEEGLGVSYLPLTMVKEEIKMKKLIEMKPDQIAPPKSLTYVLTKVETKEVITFIEFLKKAVENL